MEGEQPSSPPATSADRRICWVCLEEEDVDDVAKAEERGSLLGGGRRSSSRNFDAPNRLCHPCRCTHLDVHQLCLLRWISERQESHPGVPVHCPACLHIYEIVEPFDAVLTAMRVLDAGVRFAVPYASAAVLASSVYAVAAAYGAYALVVAAGPEAAAEVLSDDNPAAARLWVGLPVIPFALVAARLDVADNILPVLPFVLVTSSLQPLIVSLPPSPAVTLCLLPWARFVFVTFGREIHRSRNRRAVYKEVWRLVYHFTPSKQPISQMSLDSITRLTRSSSSQTVLPPPQHAQVPPNGRGRAANTLNVNAHANNGTTNGETASRPPGPPNSLPRLILGALLLPGLASAAGAAIAGLLSPATRARLLPTIFLRTVVGGGCLILCKDLVAYWGFLRRTRGRGRDGSLGGRRVLDYADGRSTQLSTNGGGSAFWFSRQSERNRR
ncbi:hypothetical protein HDU83_004497 [Entophlyctis luteolus]|nr:hypothetical protein HDU83_004497 [Entophlyctis luteolus]KAJ3393349.1 hypothetical protein HDU84_002144 [Entophlyctis sp. JEL0112]